MWRDPDGYDAQDVVCLVWGGRTGSGDRGLSWATIRSRVERTGDVEDAGWLEVLDLERALRLLSQPEVFEPDPRNPDRRRRRLSESDELALRRAGMLLASHLLCGFGVDELGSLLPRGVPPLGLMRAGEAWITEYLNGQTIRDCERAFFRAMPKKGAEAA